METIRSAIAKARADRAAARVNDTGTALNRTGHSSPTALPRLQLGPELLAAKEAAVGPTEAAAITARWQALPAFSPSPPAMARGHIVTFTGSPEAAHFDMIRTRLLQLMQTNGWRRVAITSPGPACGKSTLALNLAFSLGRQPSMRTLLLEMDLRRPSLAQILGLHEKHHSARVLAGLESLAQNAVRHDENLAIATQSGPAHRSAELLYSPTTAAALDVIDAEYDPRVILCDLPPLFAADDAMAVMGQMDAALIVAAAESTTIKEIDRCEREIATQTNVMGVILNKCRYMERDYGYDYYSA